MTIALKPPRSIFAAKLGEFPDIALGDQAVFSRRGRWRDFFGRRIGAKFDGRIILEIGCADAALLNRMAAKFPDSGFVGLDWKCKAIYDGAKRSSELKLNNIALLRGRGQDVVRIFGAGEVDEILAFHPDPCDRPAELKNRLIAEPFLLDVHRVLRDESGILSLKTDHAGYYQWVLGLFGIAEPEWFQNGAAAPPKFRKRDLMRREDIPNRSEAVCRHFKRTMHSADFWNDPAALAHASDRCFSGLATSFESRFIGKKQPIYFFEIQKMKKSRRPELQS